LLQFRFIYFGRMAYACPVRCAVPSFLDQLAFCVCLIVVLELGDQDGILSVPVDHPMLVRDSP